LDHCASLDEHFLRLAQQEIGIFSHSCAAYWQARMVAGQTGHTGLCFATGDLRHSIGKRPPPAGIQLIFPSPAFNTENIANLFVDF